MLDVTVLLRIVGILAALAIVFRVVLVINNINKQTRISIRVALAAVSASSAGSLIWLLDDNSKPSFLAVCLLVGLASFLWADRRGATLKQLLNPVVGRGPQHHRGGHSF